MTSQPDRHDVPAAPSAKATAGTGRIFKISMKGIPPVTAESRARMEAAARNPAQQRRDYPQVNGG